MLSSNGEGLQIRSRLQFSQPSQPTPSQALNSAFRGCNIIDSQQQSQHVKDSGDTAMTPSQPTPPIASQPDSQQLITQQYSQPPGLGSQDFLTPADQQFEAEPAIGGKKMRSPLNLTPKGKKRQRSNLSAGSQNSQGPPVFSQNLQKLATHARYSPRCTHNIFNSSSADPEPGKVARRLPCAALYRELFKEIRVLGQGNFSKVFQVKNRIDGYEYAVKRSKQEVCEEPLKKQWFQEIQALAAAGAHENIVRYYFSWIEEARGGVHFYIQLEKCGSSLGQRFSVDKQPLKEAELIDILRQMAAALQHLHGRGIAHMDVKPDNVYCSPEGTYKLGDFGLATTLNSKPDVNVEEGDCKYLPAEVLNGNYNRLDKADMFSLGAMLYQLATGIDLPENGEQYTSLRKGKVRLIPGYSTGFHAMLTKLLSPDPTDRPSPKKVLTDKLLNRQPVYKQLQLQSAAA